MGEGDQTGERRAGAIVHSAPTCRSLRFAEVPKPLGSCIRICKPSSNRAQRRNGVHSSSGEMAGRGKLSRSTLELLGHTPEIEALWVWIALGVGHCLGRARERREVHGGHSLALLLFDLLVVEFGE